MRMTILLYLWSEADQQDFWTIFVAPMLCSPGVKKECSFFPVRNFWLGLGLKHWLGHCWKRWEIHGYLTVIWKKLICSSTRTLLIVLYQFNQFSSLMFCLIFFDSGLFFLIFHFLGKLSKKCGKIIILVELIELVQYYKLLCISTCVKSWLITSWHILCIFSKANAIAILKCFVDVVLQENFDSIPNFIISGAARSGSHLSQKTLQDVS